MSAPGPVAEVKRRSVRGRHGTIARQSGKERAPLSGSQCIWSAPSSGLTVCAIRRLYARERRRYEPDLELKFGRETGVPVGGSGWAERRKARRAIAGPSSLGSKAEVSTDVIPAPRMRPSTSKLQATTQVRRGSWRNGYWPPKSRLGRGGRQRPDGCVRGRTSGGVRGSQRLGLVRVIGPAGRESQYWFCLYGVCVPLPAHTAPRRSFCRRVADGCNAGRPPNGPRALYPNPTGYALMHTARFVTRCSQHPARCPVRWAVRLQPAPPMYNP